MSQEARWRRIARLFRELAKEFDDMDGPNASSTANADDASAQGSDMARTTEIINALRDASVEDIRMRLKPMLVSELEHIARHLAVPFSHKKSTKDELITDITKELRRSARMSAVEEETRKAFSNPS